MLTSVDIVTPSPLSPRVNLSLTYLPQFLVIPEQGKGAEHQLPVQLPAATSIRKGDTFSLVRQEA